MPRIDSDMLKKATVYIGEKSYSERQRLRDMFIAQGLKQVTCHADMSSLRKLLQNMPPDLLVIGSDFDPKVYDLVRDIRMQHVGDNPFMLISVLVDPSHRAGLDQAISVGVDDIIIKPVSPERVQERLKLVTFHRRPFIAIDGYVGPERKADDGLLSAKRIPVLNTLLEKVNGRELDRDALKAAVDGSLQMVIQAQLDSQSFRLGEVCERLVHAYDAGDVTEDVQNDLLSLADVLRGAARLSERLSDSQLSGLCRSLAENVTMLADHYDTPSTVEIDLIRKITSAFSLAMKPAGPTEPAQREAIDLMRAKQEEEEF
jgi:AmiR/NasT family two-component response regulator